MNIPTKFKLLGHTYTVEFDNVACIKDECLGKHYKDLNKIMLTTESLVENKKVDLPKSQIEHSYYHELVHAILSAMGEDDLNGNEKFVDGFAGLLHQIMTTQK